MRLTKTKAPCYDVVFTLIGMYPHKPQISSFCTITLTEIWVAFTLLLFPASVLASWQYRSRPDLSPPVLNITINATDKVAKGYLFVAPYPDFNGPSGAGPEQAGAYIFRNNGDLVWSGQGYYGGWVSDFQATLYGGQPVLSAFQGTLLPSQGRAYGYATLLNQSYQEVASFRSLSGLISLHEFRLCNQQTALVEVPQSVPYDLQPYGGQPIQQWIVDNVFQGTYPSRREKHQPHYKRLTRAEVNIATSEVVFEWRSLNHVDPRCKNRSPFPKENANTAIDSALPMRGPRGGLAGTTSKNAWDWFHLNSVDKDESGNYLVSSRHMNAIYKVSGTDGSVIWQLGGNNSTFHIPDDAQFGFQHDARFLSRSVDGSIETISFLDNSVTATGKPVQKSSSARIFQLNHADLTATEIHRYPAPDGLVVESQGNVQMLPNKNVFVNWGQAGAITEFDGNTSEPIFHAYLDTGGSGAQSYRGFRSEWEGRPWELPAIAALRSGDKTTIYVSWNGDTLTAIWDFWAVGKAANSLDWQNSRPLGSAQRTSFETALTVNSATIASLGEVVGVYARAAGSRNEGLVKTPVVTIKQDIEPAKDAASGTGNDAEGHRGDGDL